MEIDPEATVPTMLGSSVTGFPAEAELSTADAAGAAAASEPKAADKQDGKKDKKAGKKDKKAGKGGGKGRGKNRSPARSRPRGPKVLARSGKDRTDSAPQTSAKSLAGSVVMGPILRHNQTIYAYGNYDQYYAQRHNRFAVVDPRIEALLKARGADFFADKAVLDLGCGDGFLTFLFASLGASRVEGVDIDAALISRALKHLRRLKVEGLDALPKAPEDSISGSRFPVSCVQCHGIVPFARKPLVRGLADGPVAHPDGQNADGSEVVAGTQQSSSSKSSFPYNIEFRTENVLVSDIEDRRSQLFDVVVCLKLTKWVHLHWGDDGIKVLLHRCFRLLRPGGVLVLEAQNWTSYCSRKHLTPHARQNHSLIKFRPEEFNTYLVHVIGFEKPLTVETPLTVEGDSANGSAALERPILIFRRPSTPPAAKPKSHPGPSPPAAPLEEPDGQWPGFEAEAKRQRTSE